MKLERTEQIKTIAKLINTSPDVLLDFVVDVGFEVISKSQENILNEFHFKLSEFLKNIESKKNKTIAPANAQEFKRINP